MQTIEDVREHCRFVGKGIERAVDEGKDLLARFEGVQMLNFKIEKDEGCMKVVGGEMGGDDSGIVVSESGVTKCWGDEIVGYVFNRETRAAMLELFRTCFNS